MNPQDEQSLLRLLGTNTVPEEVQHEYRIRVKWFHSDGHSGPMGTLALVNMLRYLGYKANPEQEKPKVTDWRAVPKDKSVQVEVEWQNEKRLGRFCGMVGAGMLMIDMDGDEMVREFPPYQVKVVGVDKEEEPDAELLPTPAAEMAAKEEAEASSARKKKSPKQ